MNPTKQNPTCRTAPPAGVITITLGRDVFIVPTDADLHSIFQLIAGLIPVTRCNTYFATGCSEWFEPRDADRIEIALNAAPLLTIEEGDARRAADKAARDAQDKKIP